MVWMIFQPSRIDDSYSRANLSVADARQLDLEFDFPDDAREISVYQPLLSNRLLSIDFMLAEEAFEQWAAKQGWIVKRIVGTVTVTRLDRNGHRQEQIVTDGYVYHTLQREKPNTLLVVYDRQSTRVFYRFQALASDGE